MALKRVFYIFIVVLILLGCAQQKPLSGGERDFTPPKVMAAYPPALTTDFRSKSFVIEFDEYVQLNNIQQELLVSPPLQKAPVVKVKNRQVIVELQEPLKENTTYTFNFSDGVTDLNEGNKAEDLIYVISTGPSLDSLAIHGKAAYPLNNVGAGGIRILVFDDTVNVAQEKLPAPAYFTRTKKDGDFVLPFMREGKFNVFALEDLNGNFQVDEDERVSVAQISIAPQVVDSSAVSFDFQLFPQMIYRPNLANYNVDSIGQFILPWSPFFEERLEYRLQFLGEKEGMLYFNDAKDTLYYELKGPVTERYEKLLVRFGEETDTLDVLSFQDEDREKMKISHSVSNRIVPGDTLFFYTPYSASAATEMKLKEDSTVIAELMPQKQRENKFFIQPVLQPGKKYELFLPENIFQDRSGKGNDSLKIHFTTYMPEDLGRLVVQPDEAMQELQGWLELYNRTNVLVKKHRIQPGETEIVWNNLIPSEYTIRFYVDDNDNGIWDPTHFPAQLEAEEIYVFPDKLNVRANWDLKQQLELPE